MRRSAAARPSTPTRRCRSGTASTASICPKDGASGTTAARRRCRRSCRCCTPEYQERMVRQLYHEGVDAAHQWSASYCWPEGFMRQWATGPKPQRIVVTPDVVVFLGSGSGNIVRIAHVDRELPLGPRHPAVVRRHRRVLGRRRADHAHVERAGVDAAHHVGVQLRVRDHRDSHAGARRRRASCWASIGRP